MLSWISNLGRARCGAHLFAALFLAFLLGLFAFAAIAGLTGSLVAATIVAVMAAIGSGLTVCKRIASSIDLRASSRGLRAASWVAAVAAVAMLSRLTVFIVDPSRTSYSVAPGNDFELHHACNTAYFVAANVVTHVRNVYDLSIYAAPDDDVTKPRKPRTIGLFRVDQYEYPPPFLLLPRAVLLVVPDFLRYRMVWFGLNGFIVLLGLVIVARHLKHEAATRGLLLVPFVLGSFVTLNTLQKGNVQLAVIALSMMAVALIERRRAAAGGALLACVTVAKLYPGLLVIYLLVRRERRALAWTGAVSVLLLLLTLADLGWMPFAAFRQQFPNLMSGEAFPAFRNPVAVAVNQSIPGLVFKLRLFGFSNLGFGAARVVGTIYILVALVLTVILARRTVREDQRPIAWITILLFATLRSPFLPQAYAAFPALWLLTLLVATGAPRQWSVMAFLAVFAVLSVFVPQSARVNPRLVALITTVPQTLIIALALVVVRLLAAPGPAVAPQRVSVKPA